MAGELDEISRIIGNIESDIKNMQRSMDQDRRLHNERHAENTEKLESIGERVGNLEDTVKPLGETVKRMEPIVAGVQIDRWKKAGAISLAGLILTFVGWLLALLIEKAFAWVAAHIFR